MSDSNQSGTTSQTSLSTSSTNQPAIVYEHKHLSSAARLIRSDSAKHARGRSLGLIDAARVRLSKDFPSLLRSNSKTSRQARLQTEAIPSGSSCSSSSEYAKPHQQGSALSEFAQMDMSAAHDERHGRSLGSRIVNFLSRSRSRSRSRKRRSRSLDALTGGEVPALPTPTGTLGRHTRHSSMQDENHAPSSSLSKPASRIRSRPLSSTTTATDTTVKPTQKKLPDIPSPQPYTRPPDHEVHIQANILPLDSSHPSRKGKKMNIFAMGLPPRKSSVDSKKSTRSRPSSPSPGDSAIALPADRPNWMGRLRSGSGSKSTTPQSGSQRSGTTAYSQANSTAPSDFLSTAQPSQTHRSVPRPEIGRVGLDGQPDSGDFGGRCSPLCWPHSRTTPPIVREKSADRDRMRGAKERASSATRDRVHERDRDRITVHRVGSPILRERERESRSALGAVPMERVASASGASRRSSGQGSAIPNASAINISKIKQNKHGSFDFERPVSSRPDAVNMKSALRDMGIGPDTKVPASHSMQRSVSLRATPRVINATTTGLSGAPPHKPNNLTNAGNRSTKPQLDTLQIGPSRRKADVASAVSSSFPQTSTRTPHFAERDPASPVSSTSGHSSSWGRSAGKHALRSAHGAFRFEPAVPTIPGSPAHDERQSAARGTPGSPTRLKPDRVGAKGRSLDLGIGLTWAPSTVKEEAVLAYGAGRPGGGISASTSRARARWRGGWVDEDGRLGASDPGGSDVAEAFKEALGEAAYVTFKNYVHRFDADAIPLDGPYGLISHVKRLLDEANSLGEREKRALIDRFVRFVHENR